MRRMQGGAIDVDGIIDLTEPVYESRDDGRLVVEREEWIGILLAAADRAGDRISRQQAVETLQRYAVEEKGWDAYPGSCGVSGPHAYVLRGENLVRSVRWAPNDVPAGMYWRVVLGQGMRDGEGDAAPVQFDDPLEL
jgi:hypothetical protein